MVKLPFGLHVKGPPSRVPVWAAGASSEAVGVLGLTTWVEGSGPKSLRFKGFQGASD